MLQVLGILSKAFPQSDFPSDNFRNVQLPRRLLPEGYVSTPCRARALRVGQTWEVATSHLVKFSWEVATWEKVFGKYLTSCCMLTLQVILLERTSGEEWLNSYLNLYNNLRENTSLLHPLLLL